RAGSRRRALADMDREAEATPPPASEALDSEALESEPVSRALAEPDGFEACPVSEPIFAPRLEAEHAAQEAETGRPAGILDVRAFALDDFAPTPAAQTPAAQTFTEESLGDENFDGDAGDADSFDDAIAAQPQIFRPAAPLGARAPGEPIGQGLFDAYSQAIAARTAASGPAPAASIFSADAHTDFAHPDFALPAREETASAPITAAPETGAAPGAVRPFAGPESRSAAARIESRELDELSQLELLERLALAMTRRREEMERQASLPVEPVEVAAEPLETTPVEEAAAAEEPVPAIPVIPDVKRGAAPLLAPVADVAPTPAPETAPEQARVARIPAAMRPVDLDAFDDEDEPLPGYIPPRHIGAGTLRPFDAPSAAPQDAPELAGADAGSDEDEESVLEEGYSSLLNLSRSTPQRQEFVRIEEPETPDEVEPVVVFPGDERPVQGLFARRTGEPETDETPSVRPVALAPAFPAMPAAMNQRLFDAPGKHDAEETEKALRSALATLQRMSGAA
ncbi:hypothetical protein MTR62_16690, partial [Novosphingobium sp. 1949]|nr:hypothetical protein [Novosphingobium organovorum]